MKQLGKHQSLDWLEMKRGWIFGCTCSNHRCSTACIRDSDINCSLVPEAVNKSQNANGSKGNKPMSDGSNHCDRVIYDRYKCVYFYERNKCGQDCCYDSVYFSYVICYFSGKKEETDFTDCVNTDILFSWRLSILRFDKKFKIPMWR